MILKILKSHEFSTNLKQKNTEKHKPSPWNLKLAPGKNTGEREEKNDLRSPLRNGPGYRCQSYSENCVGVEIFLKLFWDFLNFKGKIEHVRNCQNLKWNLWGKSMMRITSGQSGLLSSVLKRVTCLFPMIMQSLEILKNTVTFKISKENRKKDIIILDFQFKNRSHIQHSEKESFLNKNLIFEFSASCMDEIKHLNKSQLLRYRLEWEREGGPFHNRPVS